MTNVRRLCSRASWSSERSGSLLSLSLLCTAQHSVCSSCGAEGPAACALCADRGTCCRSTSTRSALTPACGMPRSRPLCSWRQLLGTAHGCSGPTWPPRVILGAVHRCHAPLASSGAVAARLHLAGINAACTRSAACAALMRRPSCPASCYQGRPPAATCRDQWNNPARQAHYTCICNSDTAHPVLPWLQLSSGAWSSWRPVMLPME